MIERALAYEFRRPELLEQALTHRSAAHELGEEGFHNERLEFLGDAVLDLLVSELLMESGPDADEGSLSRARADAVNAHALAERAREFALGDALRLGRGEERQGGRTRASILGNAFEAVVAAVYLDGGLEAARDLVRRAFGDLTSGKLRLLVDPKTRLQEVLQSRGEALPRYETVVERGPDHAREFEVCVWAGDRALGTGKGTSKRAAEQAAAARALDEVDPGWQDGR